MLDFTFNVSADTKKLENMIMDLKSVLESGKNEILQTVRSEAAQHAAKIDELNAKIAVGNVTPEELQTALGEIAAEIRGIVPDEAVEPPVEPPVGE